MNGHNPYSNLISGLGVLAGVINTYIASTPDEKLPESIKRYRFWIGIFLLCMITIASFSNPTIKIDGIYQ